MGHLFIGGVYQELDLNISSMLYPNFAVLNLSYVIYCCLYESKVNEIYWNYKMIVESCFQRFCCGNWVRWFRILGHSISIAGWPICQWIRKVSLGWLFHSTMLTISYWLTRRVSIYKHLVSYLMSYQSVHFWVLFFCTTFYTIFHRICITPLQIDFCSLYQRYLSS